MDIKVGDWFTIRFGFSDLDWYVLEVRGETVFLGQPKWLVSSSIRMERSKVEAGEYLGPSRRRWWWRFVPFRDLVCPFCRPAGMWWK